MVFEVGSGDVSEVFCVVRLVFKMFVVFNKVDVLCSESFFSYRDKVV